MNKGLITMEKEKKKKLEKYKCKLYSTYSIQFWFDRRGARLTTTSNPSEGKELKDMTCIDMYLFGTYIANSKLLDKEDKKMLKVFCEKFLLQIELNKSLKSKH